MPDLKHPIKVVTNRTGLSPHVIRAWERRYGVVEPTRTEGNQRLYSSADIERLDLLRRGTELGHSISNLALLPTIRLRKLLTDEAGRVSGPKVDEVSEPPILSVASSLDRPTQPLPTRGSEGNEAAHFLTKALEAVACMDAPALEHILDRAALDLGGVRLLQELIQPLVKEIGERWSTGDLRVSHEHVSTAIIRTFLGRIARPISIHPNAPVLVCTTPAGQLHELGSLLVASVAASQGWRILYAGPSLPAEEIASISLHLRARAVALSIVFPYDDPALGDELVRLRSLLHESTAIIVGGRAASAYAAALHTIRASVCGDLADFAANLAGLRRTVGAIQSIP